MDRIKKIGRSIYRDREFAIDEKEGVCLSKS